MDSPLFLGLDGGGSKTAACILDARGRELGRGQGGPCNIATADDAALAASIGEATAEARAAAGLPPGARFAGVCAGVAGYTAKRRRADFARLLADVCPAERHRVEPDYVIAWWGATGGEPGIIVSAGTGAVVYGRTAAGEEARVDGRGFLLGDLGSGFSIGRQALMRAILRVDRGEAQQPFDRALFEAIGADDADDAVEWVYRDLSPGKVATLAEVVGRMAAEGDVEALGVLDRAARALARSADAALRRLKLRPDSVGVWLLGGLWGLGAPIRASFEERLPKMWYAAHPDMAGDTMRHGTPDIRAPLHDAAYGAALLAMSQQAAP